MRRPIEDEHMGIENLKEQLAQAINNSLQEIERMNLSDSLCGYALLTDDNLSTIGCATIGRGHLSSVGEFARFEPVDWPLFPAGQAFEALSNQLSLLSDGSSREDHGEYVRQVFRILVESLLNLRLRGVFAGEVFLTVVSTDPNELLESLEIEAVQTLNSENLLREWMRWREGY